MNAIATHWQSREQGLLARLAEARKRTDELFAIVRPETLYERPIPQRHRVIFYLGHVEAFDWNLLSERAFGLPTFLPTFDRLFAFGIDPVDGGVPMDTEADWPKREAIERYNAQVREKLDAALSHALRSPRKEVSELWTILETAIEHRLMHLETLGYMLHRLDPERKYCQAIETTKNVPAMKPRLIEIPAGEATLGLNRAKGEEFGWDNEFEAHAVDVPAFAVQDLNVTNGEFLEFLEAGGYENDALWGSEAQEWKKNEGVKHPGFWRRVGNLWMYRTMFGEIPLPLQWPVYVSHAEASAYAKWLGRTLPSEAEFHRAAYGTPDRQIERAYPWGNDTPSAEHGNFDFQRWEPLPVGSKPRGASAFGLHDMVGNGWEWTRTPFAPFEGFVSREFYPGYSADFFDGKHFVMKGGSSRTAACMLRRSFRNWFQPHYPFVYATFRCVES
jgi:gamma-glutamyl hercynylcysteine S-oxide synthase